MRSIGAFDLNSIEQQGVDKILHTYLSVKFETNACYISVYVIIADIFKITLTVLVGPMVTTLIKNSARNTFLVPMATLIEKNVLAIKILLY